MPAKRCIETKNMCLLFVDYCNRKLFFPRYTQFPFFFWVQKTFFLRYTQFPFFFWVQNSLFSSCTQLALISALSGRFEIINGFHNVNDIHGVFDNINNIIQ